MPTTRFEHYTVLEREDGSLWELGRGAMGVTYKATDTDLHCTVALKVINPAILNTEGTEQRFLREARAAAQLRHPNIATVLRLGKTEDGTHFYAMEFCEGDTLEQLVANDGPLRIALALEFTLQVAKALVVAEEHDVVHRDIKPSNLIIGSRRDEDLVVKVIDFGLAKSVAGAGNAWSSMTLATAGFIGTAHFSSPEQLEEGEVDVRSDIYSLGATLWFMLTGKPMFSGSVPRIMSQHLSSPPPWEQLNFLRLSNSVRQLLATMLAKDPKERPKSAIDLKRRIQLCLQGGPVNARERRERKIDQNADSSSVLNERWSLLEEHGRGVGGRLYRAMDLTAKDRVVAVRFLDPQLHTNKASWAQLERTIPLLEGAPAGVVRPIQLDRDHNERPFLVTEWVNGIPLPMFLRHRGSLTLKETLHLLKDLTPAFDYAVEGQTECAPFCKEQVQLAFPEEVSVEKQFDQLTRKPITEWADLHAVIDLLPITENSDSADATLFSMQTVLPGGPAASAARVPHLRDIGLFTYELLGGTASPGKRHYVPIVRLSAEGNELLKSVLSSTEHSLSAAQFLDRLTQTAGFEPTWKPPISFAAANAPPRATHLHHGAWMNVVSAIETHPIRFATALFALAVGVLWLSFFSSQDQKYQQETESRSDSWNTRADTRISAASPVPRPTEMPSYEVPEPRKGFVPPAALPSASIATFATPPEQLPRIEETPPPSSPSVAFPRPWVLQTREFVKNFVASSSLPDASKTASFYSSKAEVFDEGVKDREFIQRDIQVYNERWPTRRNDIQGDIQITEKLPYSDYGASFQQAYYVENTTRREWIKGTVAVDMGITVSSGAPKIASIKQKTLSREKGLLPPSSQATFAATLQDRTPDRAPRKRNSFGMIEGWYRGQMVHEDGATKHWSYFVITDDNFAFHNPHELQLNAQGQSRFGVPRTAFTYRVRGPIFRDRDGTYIFAWSTVDLIDKSPTNLRDSDTGIQNVRQTWKQASWVFRYDEARLTQVATGETWELAPKEECLD